jgi:hypothetical protein
MKTRSLLLLLGSGASPAPQGMALTDAVLNKPMYWHSRGRWALQKNASVTFGTLETFVPRFLVRIRGMIACWQNRPLRDVSYEDIGAVCADLWKERGIRRNPLVAPAVRPLEEEYGPLAVDALAYQSLTPRDGFNRLVEDSLSWLHWAVVYELRNEPIEGTSALESFLRDALGANRSWVIATLNHDLLIERALQRAGITFSDGFARSGGVRVFSPRRLHRSGTVLKLHGGIDWRWHPDYRSYVREVNEAHRDSIYASERPEFLIGTYTRPEEYGQGVLPKLFAAFDLALEDAGAIIICGYGFRDAGVNSRLLSELGYSP